MVTTLIWHKAEANRRTDNVADACVTSTFVVIHACATSTSMHKYLYYRASIVAYLLKVHRVECSHDWPGTCILPPTQMPQ